LSQPISVFLDDFSRVLSEVFDDNLIFEWLFSDEWQLKQIAKHAIRGESNIDPSWILKLWSKHPDWTQVEWLLFVETYAISDTLLNVLNLWSEKVRLEFWTNRHHDP
jgi:hypothetical protein